MTKDKQWNNKVDMEAPNDERLIRMMGLFMKNKELCRNIIINITNYLM